MTKAFVLLCCLCFVGSQSIFGIVQVLPDPPLPELEMPKDQEPIPSPSPTPTPTPQSSPSPSPSPNNNSAPAKSELGDMAVSPPAVFQMQGQEQLQDVVFPFQPVQGYPSELQGIWTADPVLYQYSSPDDPRILQSGTTQCDLYLVTNLGISVYDYSPVARCDELGVLTTRLFLKQIEGDVAYGTDYTIYYALLFLQCTGDQEGTLIEVSSQGSYQCVLFKRIENLLYIVYGFIYPTFEEVQCPSSWDVDVTSDPFADSSIVYSSFDTGVYKHDLATCIG